MNKNSIPPFIHAILQQLHIAGYEAYVVGGCVRDMLMNDTPSARWLSGPKDWDITTNARPEQIQIVFQNYKTVYENLFGTVTVLNMSPVTDQSTVTRETPDTNNSAQITTYRSESDYSDTRHPDTVSYETDIMKDLERRDFTMNAIAWDPIKDIYKDPFNGIKDIKDKVVRCVLDPQKRFSEDALRILRAIRFSTTLGFSIENETLRAISEKASTIQHISIERTRDEFLKIIHSDQPAFGISLLERTEVLQYIVPELRAGIGCEQKGAHIYDVFDHLLHALQHAADKHFSQELRLSALFHDIGKPATRRYEPKKDKYTFFGHEVVGARMTKKILERLRVPRETSDLVVTLVRNHMFFSDTEQITLSAVRRIIAKVGHEHIWELMQVRECDRVGMKKVEAPYRLRKYFAMIEQCLRDPISVSQLALDGKYLIEVLNMKPGIRMGWILHTLLEEVLENPELNTIEQLTERVKDLDELEDTNLKKLGEKGKGKKDEAEASEVGKLHVKHGVKR